MAQPADPTTATGSHHKPKASMRSLAALLTAVTACIAAVTAFIRASDESVTKSSYDTLSQGIAEVDNKCRRDREDLISLRSYVDGYLRTPMAVATTPELSGQGTADAGAPAPIPIRPFVAPPHPTHPAASAAPPPTPPPPTAFAAPAAPWKAPDFSTVQKNAKGD